MMFRNSGAEHMAGTIKATAMETGLGGPPPGGLGTPAPGGPTGPATPLMPGPEAGEAPETCPQCGYTGSMMPGPGAPGAMPPPMPKMGASAPIGGPM